MDCLLPEVFDALRSGHAADMRMVRPPADMGRTRPRATGKAVYGRDLPFHVDGQNFTVQWTDPGVDAARAADILVQLEAAWTTLVAEGGWPAPTSSDTWLLWVILDPELGGSGYTTVYATDEYPDGYPVTYLNPSYDAENPAFALSVAVHEFGHMLQYRLRDWELGRADAWYWEATSEWIAERVAPDLDTYAESTFWYAQWPHARFDATERYHPYGMVLVNAWLDERAFGFDGVRDVWLAADGNDRAWDALLAEQAGDDFGGIVAAMAAEVAARTLREGALYEAPVREAEHSTAPVWETRALPGLYGSYFIDVGEGAIVVEGQVHAAFVQDGALLDAAPAEGAYTAVLTAYGEEGELGYGTTPPADAEEEPGEAPVACGCASVGAPAGGAVWVGLAGAVGAAARRRRLPRGRGAT